MRALKHPVLAGVNVGFSVLIPVWLLVKSALAGFDVGFAWEPQPDIFVSMEFTMVNMVLLFASAVVMLYIGIVLFKRHLINKKDAPKFLGTFNVVMAAGLAWDGIRKYTTFTDEAFRNAIEALIFMFLAWALIFFVMFLQEIFTGSSNYADHKPSHLAIVVLISAAVFFFIGWPDLMPLVVSTYVAYGCLLAIILPLGAWQFKSGIRLVKKVDDKHSKIGLLMIGFSAIFYLGALGTVAFKKAFFPLDLLLSVLLLGLSITTYLGYVYPSRS